jgi:hypothetical protein
MGAAATPFYGIRLMVQRPENIAGAHREKVEAGVTGQSPRAPTGALPVTGPAGFVFVRLPQARTLYHHFFVYRGCRRPPVQQKASGGLGKGACAGQLSRLRQA